ncbi:MAG: conjugative transfer system coupling protein TraD [Gammaproteobacteria bacterium]|nr:conjugative transfer system coupling protein TraD [Gammaproteobacteria bacterium]
MKPYSLDCLLRPPLEWWTTLTASSVAIFMAMKGSDGLSLTSPFADGLAIGLMLLASWRFRQGWQLIRYQKRLKQLPAYRLASASLPTDADKLFLGKGFAWQPKHTQRWYSLQPFLANLTATTNQEGCAAIHGMESHEQLIYLPQAHRFGHTLILGTTRVGKTRLLELLISGDIQRCHSPVIVIDPKGDIDLLRRMVYEARQVNRLHQLRIFHLGHPEHSVRYNPIGQFSRITEVASRVTHALPAQGEAAAFRAFAWRYVNTIARALCVLGQRPTYRAIEQHLTTIHPLLKAYACYLLHQHGINWQQAIKQQCAKKTKKAVSLSALSCEEMTAMLVNVTDEKVITDSVHDSLRAIWDCDDGYFQKVLSALLPLLAKLTTGQIADLLSPDYLAVEDDRAMINWQQVIAHQQIVYVGLDALSDRTVAQTIGHAMFADLCSTLGEIYKGRTLDTKTGQPIPVYADEFNELVSEEWITLANKGGGAGLQLTAATQTGSDLIAQLGNTAKANQLIGNFNNLICLRVLDRDTATLFTDKLPQQVTVHQLIPQSGVQESEAQPMAIHNADQWSAKSVPLISADTLLQLPKGQAFCLLQGGQCYKVRFPLPEQNETDQVPDQLAEIVTGIASHE